jgi:hypothetical protein
VEPVIGTLVNFLGMRRVNTRGIKLANKCLLVAATCYNLKRLLKWMGETALKEGKKTLLHFILLWLFLVHHGRKNQVAAVFVQ